jgi:Reverse transcriptase (RNA-dependent DNA polymerase)
MILAMGAALNLKMHQIDIKGAYLNSKLTPGEIIYMKQPPGYAEPNLMSKVCCLKKTLYGLKQSGCRWYQKLVYILVDNLHFTCCDVDQAVFIHNSKNELTIIAVHVDDCTLVASTITLIQNLKNGIHKFVEISDLGELHWLLGIEIKRNREARTIHLSQRSYIDSILHQYNLKDAKPLSTPMETNIQHCPVTLLSTRFCHYA